MIKGCFLLMSQATSRKCFLVDHRCILFFFNMFGRLMQTDSRTPIKQPPIMRPPLIKWPVIKILKLFSVKYHK